MDLAWRVCTEFLLHEFSATCRGFSDEQTFSFIAHDPTLLLNGKRIKMLNRIADSSTTTSERRAVVERALQTRDITKMRQCVRTLLHYSCTQLRWISQDADSSRSTQFSITSRIYSPPSLPHCTHGPRAPFGSGLCVLVTIHPSTVGWLSHVFLLFPSMIKDPALGDVLQSDSLYASHNFQTPRRVDDTNSTAEPTPTWNAKEEILRCEICLRTVPFSSCMFLEQCTHYFCLTCLTACAVKHSTLSFATPSNMPCPSLTCKATLLPQEVRLLVSSEKYSSLEAAEVRFALQDDCVVCPTCTLTFESVLNAGIMETDPLRFKIKCPACESVFCRRCRIDHFHDGRQCLDGGAGKNTPKCRYCGNAASSLEPLVCDSKECEAKGKQSCLIQKRCGHACYGSSGEQKCVSCLEDGCSERHEIHSADDFCVICFTDALRDAPCLELDCGHVFHAQCLHQKLEKRWPTARVSFHFFSCPVCCKDIAHQLLSKWTEPIIRLREQIDSRSIERLKIEGMWECDALTVPSSPYYQRPLEYARDKLNYYQCSKCNRPYFGGLRECQNVDREEPDRSDLICGGCSAGSAVCSRHGNQYMEWKCKYCCNTAVWYCWGTTHFCELCHSPPRKSVREECQGEELCPLKGRHQPNGVEFAIGCAMCRAEHVDKRD